MCGLRVESGWGGSAVGVEVGWSGAGWNSGRICGGCRLWVEWAVFLMRDWIGKHGMGLGRVGSEKGKAAVPHDHPKGGVSFCVEESAGVQLKTKMYIEPSKRETTRPISWMRTSAMICLALVE